MHKVFISYHHANDQQYKDQLVALGTECKIFIDKSVDTGDISDILPADRIREIIRDKYLRDSTVTIVLVGKETRHREHIAWEIYSSMYNGAVNKQSGILVITLPTAHCTVFASHGREEFDLYGQSQQPQVPVFNSRAECKPYCYYMPEGIVDNLANPRAMISVASWDSIELNPWLLRGLVELTFRDRVKCKYISRSPNKIENLMVKRR